jgi:hypothetical protein
MAEVSWLIAFGLSLTSGVALVVVGAFLLRSAIKDTSDLVATLPTREIEENATRNRTFNRCKALAEVLLLLFLRSLPGWSVVIFGAFFLIWICCKLLALFHL